MTADQEVAAAYLQALTRAQMLVPELREVPSCGQHALEEPAIRWAPWCDDCAARLLLGVEPTARILFGNPSAKPPAGVLRVSEHGPLILHQTTVDALAVIWERCPACPVHAQVAPYARTFVGTCEDCRRRAVEGYEQSRRILLPEAIADRPT